MYRGGNLAFTADGNALLSPVGNRITVFDLIKCVISCADGRCAHLMPRNRRQFSHASRTLPFENRKNVAHIALSRDSRLLISVDEGESASRGQGPAADA